MTLVLRAIAALVADADGNRHRLTMLEYGLIIGSLLSLTFAQTSTIVVTAPTVTSVVTLPASIATTIYTTLPPPPPAPPSLQYTNDLTFRTSILNSTNFFRYEHGASDLTWNISLASYAASYAARCIWAHSHGPSGENLAHGYPDVTSAVDAWGNERVLYSFAAMNYTGFTESTGHFTQLVWKATRSVGCGAYDCNGTGNVSGWMVVCEYWPAGNVESSIGDKNQYFQQNVQSQVSDASGFDVYSATVGATAVGTESPARTTAGPAGTSVSNAERPKTVNQQMLTAGLLVAVMSLLVDVG